MKKIWIALIILATFTIGFATFTFFSLFPKAPELEPPEDEQIVYCTLEIQNGASTLLVEQRETLLEYMKEARATRKMSANEIPDASKYYRITLMVDEGKLQRPYVYYVYQEGGRLYLEVPYQGIYRVDAGILDILDSIGGKGYLDS